MYVLFTQLIQRGFLRSIHRLYPFLVNEHFTQGVKRGELCATVNAMYGFICSIHRNVRVTTAPKSPHFFDGKITDINHCADVFMLVSHR